MSLGEDPHETLRAPLVVLRSEVGFEYSCVEHLSAYQRSLRTFGHARAGDYVENVVAQLQGRDPSLTAMVQQLRALDRDAFQGRTGPTHPHRACLTFVYQVIYPRCSVWALQLQLQL